MQFSPGTPVPPGLGTMALNTGTQPVALQGHVQGTEVSWWQGGLAGCPPPPGRSSSYSHTSTQGPPYTPPTLPPHTPLTAWPPTPYPPPSLGRGGVKYSTREPFPGEHPAWGGGAPREEKEAGRAPRSLPAPSPTILLG